MVLFKKFKGKNFKDHHNPWILKRGKLVNGWCARQSTYKYMQKKLLVFVYASSVLVHFRQWPFHRYSGFLEISFLLKPLGISINSVPFSHWSLEPVENVEIQNSPFIMMKAREAACESQIRLANSSRANSTSTRVYPGLSQSRESWHLQKRCTYSGHCSRLTCPGKEERKQNKFLTIQVTHSASLERGVRVRARVFTRRSLLIHSGGERSSLCPPSVSVCQVHIVRCIFWKLVELNYYNISLFSQ